MDKMLLDTATSAVSISDALNPTSEPYYILIGRFSGTCNQTAQGPRLYRAAPRKFQASLDRPPLIMA